MHTTKLIHGVRWSLALLLALGAWLLMQPLTARAETIPVTSTLDSGAGCESPTPMGWLPQPRMRS